MENAADALILAGSVFVLVIILSVTAFAFSNSRESLDNIFAIADKEYMSVKGDEEYYYLSSSGNTKIARNVGIETVIPSVYRAFNENYKIQFVFEIDNDYFLYKDREGNEIKSLDLSELTLSDSQKKELIKALLYHKYLNGNDMNQFNTDFLQNRY